MDTISPSWKLLFNIVSFVAEFERDMINERVQKGCRVAVVKGC